jgi:hypothetical protein
MYVCPENWQKSFLPSELVLLALGTPKVEIPNHLVGLVNLASLTSF